MQDRKTDVEECKYFSKRRERSAWNEKDNTVDVLVIFKVSMKANHKKPEKEY